MRTDTVELEQLLKEMKNNEDAMKKLTKYVKRLHKQVKKDKFYKDLDRMMEKVISGKAKFIPEEEVWKKFGV